MEKLFVYGTLRDPQVQKKVFGRVVGGSPDKLCGYVKQMIEVEGEIYPVLVLSNSNNDRVDGLVLGVSEKELRSADEYETGAYERVKASLESGNKAWVYIKSSAYPENGR